VFQKFHLAFSAKVITMLLILMTEVGLFFIEYIVLPADKGQCGSVAVWQCGTLKENGCASLP
jgi:hypothetical protein